MTSIIHSEDMVVGSVGRASVMLAIGAVGVAVSLATVFYYLAADGHAAFNTSAEVPWGLAIATYVFFVLASTGLTFVASLATVFKFEQFYPVAKRCIWLALATVVAGFCALALELGHPFRLFTVMPFSMQLRSPMFWMGAFYGLYIVLLLLKFAAIEAGDWNSRWSRGLGIASLLSDVLATGNLGALFGMLAMRPYWYDGFNFVYFLVIAAPSGIAFAILFIYLRFGVDGGMPKNISTVMSKLMPPLFAAWLGLLLVFTLLRLRSGLWSSLDGLQVFQSQVSSPLFHVELWIGLVLPFLVMLFPSLKHKGKVLIGAAVLAILAIFAGRYEYLIGGQMVPVFRGVAVPGYAEYTPSIFEWMLVLLAASVTLFIQGLGEKLFDLSDTPH